MPQVMEGGGVWACVGWGEVGGGGGGVFRKTHFGITFNELFSTDNVFATSYSVRFSFVN